MNFSFSSIRSTVFQGITPSLTVTYVPGKSVTDASGLYPPDVYRNGQDASNLGATMLRIDVDNTDPGLNYAIPSDNPFVGSSWIREEIWAYGLRNPWKICFHPVTGELWAGDVGFVDWDEINIVKRGANYGWSVREGPKWFIPNQWSGPAPIESPVALYPNISGISVTGGYFVESPRLPALQDAYIYGDWITGKIYALNWDGTQLTSNQEIADTSFNIVTFGQEETGDLLFLDHANNTSLQRLIKRPPLYVDKDATAGANNGSSWSDAFITVQSALAVSVAGDEIWIAEGSYYPDKGAGQTNGLRTSNFQLKQGVEIYGGFAGTETYLSERNSDPETNNTILSGDLNQDDDTGGDNTENAYHVVMGANSDATAVLDGVTITGGNANGAGPQQSYGGGLLCFPNFGGIISNSIFENNTAMDGGAIYAENSDIHIEASSFRNNFASDEGGAMYLNNSEATLLDSTFKENVANRGGAVKIHNHCDPSFINCSFSGNAATVEAGAVFIVNNCHPSFTNNLFVGNDSGETAGAMAATSGCIPDMINCTFAMNECRDYGGAIHSYSPNGYILINCIVWGNVANVDPQIRGTASILSSNNLIEGSSIGSEVIANTDPLFLVSPSPGPDNDWAISSDNDYGNLTQTFQKFSEAAR